MAQIVEPLRWRFQQNTQEFGISSQPRVDSYENEACCTKVIFMHRPTHEPRRDKAGEYPFSWHLQGRRRLWEIRFQLRFKRLPDRPLFIGIELDHYVPVSGMLRQAQKVLISACRGIVGDCYHSSGDDPGRVDGEAEPPTFVMPLWAFDQFEVSYAGREPALDSDMEGRGMRRAEGVKEYIAAMKATLSNLAEDKVYTFCFWGISQFLDCMQWEVCGGILPGVRLDFNKLCGAPPIYFSLYELDLDQEQSQSRWRSSGADKRHLVSRKRYFLKAAVWSELRPPPRNGAAIEALQESPQSSAADEAALLEAIQAKTAEMPDLLDLLGDETTGDEPVAAAEQPIFEDLLGLSLDPALQQPGTTAATKPGPPKVETTDLLGLDF